MEDLVSDKEMKILEVTANKKLSLRTKLVIILSVFLAAIIITGSVLLGLFCPRKLSTYLKINPEDVISVYVNYAYTDGESGIGSYKTERQDLSPEYISDFITDVKRIKVVPCYVSYRVVSTYSFNICIRKDGETITYNVGGYRINGGSQSVVRYYGISEKIEALLQAYDLYSTDAVYTY